MKYSGSFNPSTSRHRRSSERARRYRPGEREPRNGRRDRTTSEAVEAICYARFPRFRCPPVVP